MQQQTKEPATATCSQGSGTGPGAEASTPAIAGLAKVDLANRPDSNVLVMLQITRDRIAIIATLDMGGLHTLRRTWTVDPAGGWRTRDPEFVAAEDRIGLELAEYLDALDLPSRVARMLPKPMTAAGAAAMAEAAKEVARA